MAKFTDQKTISDTAPHALVNEDCVVWLDASDITTLYQLSSNNAPGYTTPVTLVNEKIGMWLDKSVYQNNFGVINTSNRPSYTLSGVYFDSAGYNYLNCIKDDINGVYSFTTNQLGVSGLTMFMVVEPTVTTGTRVLLTQTWSPTSLGISTRPELTYASALSSWAPTLLLNSAYQASFKNGNIGSIEIWFDKERLSYFEQINPAPNVYEKIYGAPQKEEPKILTNLGQKLNNIKWT